MATVSTSIPSFLSNDADFRTWGSTISAALSTCGLVQTADTGQINWTTVTKPAAISTSAGYEVWRFADTLQSTTPVFIKVEYGTAGAVDRPSMWITVGSSSNGSGTITGQAGTRIQCAPSASKTAGNTQPLYVSGSTNRIAVAYNEDSTNNGFPCIWQVARTVDATGADTADAVFVAAHSGGGAASRQTIPASGAVPTTTANTPWVSPSGGSTEASASAAPLCPAILFANGKMLFGLLWLHYVTADITTGNVVSVSIFGSSRTYRTLGPNQSASWAGTASGTTVGFAMLWE